MFENLTYKQKFLALIVIFMMLAVAAYRRSFSLTLTSYSESEELKSKLEMFQQNTSNIQDLDAEILFLDQLIGKEKTAPELVQLEILNFVTNRNKNVEVVSLEEIHNATDNGFLIYTNQLILEGSFDDLLETVYTYEKEFPYSRVINVSYFTKKEFKTEKTKLYTKIIFQNYEKTNV